MVDKKPAHKPVSEAYDPELEEMLAVIRSRRQAARKMNDRAATSERTDEQTLLRDGFFTADPASGEWRFASNKAPKKRGEYSITLLDLSKSPESLCDWLAHISEKAWFDPVKFFEFFRRYRPIP